MAIAPTVRLGSFDTLPMARTRRATESEMASALAKELAHLAVGHPSNSMFREPRWTTPNRIALELPSMRLREFSADGDHVATLVCAPLALHDASLTDFAPEHSLVAALQMAGLRNVFVTDWRSASREMRFFSIESYLADLNVVVDELGGRVNLIGVCQGGWMALVYAARYPSKIHGLVPAGAPVDINACESELSRVAQRVPTSVWWSSGKDASAARICCSSGNIHRSNPKQFIACCRFRMISPRRTARG
jgi:poly-beta-hydroxyalkanoate depolymerase